MSAALKTNLSDRAHEVIGKGIANAVQNNDYRLAYIMGGAYLSGEEPLTADDMAIISIWADVCEDFPGQHFNAREGMSLAAFCIKMHTAIAKHGRAARLRDALQRTRGAKAVQFRNPSSGRGLILHPATRTDKGSDWQLTSIDPDGRPDGHNNPPTFDEGVARAIGCSTEGYWNEHGYELETVK